MRVRCNMRQFAIQSRLICCKARANGIKLFNNNKNEWGVGQPRNVQAGRFGADLRVTKPPHWGWSLGPAATRG